MSDSGPIIRPAATVVLLRDQPDGVETLMLRRSSKGSFGGMWVFPGGRVDEADRRPDDPDDEVPARRAATRETIEECALRLEPHELAPFSHWTPPPETPVRYATWFFVARASDGDVLVDGHEIHDHAWLSPREVMARRDRGEVDLAPPTYVTLHDLAEAGTVEDVMALAASRRPVPRYETRFSFGGDVQVCMWHGDDGYESADATVDGARHRLWMRPEGWVYERT